MPRLPTNPLPNLTIDDSIRLWGWIVRKDDISVCWPWVGGLKSGYPIVNLRGHYRVTRLIYKLHYGVDPGELLVCHTCDNRVCCNPHHFFLGTNKDNVDDRDSKNRGANQRFTISEEVTIFDMAEKGYTHTEIAESIGRPRRSISLLLEQHRKGER